MLFVRPTTKKTTYLRAYELNMFNGLAFNKSKLLIDLPKFFSSVFFLILFTISSVEIEYLVYCVLNKNNIWMKIHWSSQIELIEAEIRRISLFTARGQFLPPRVHFRCNTWRVSRWRPPLVGRKQIISASLWFIDC